MNTRKTNLTIWSLLSLMALALFLFAADDAEAKVRVKAKVRTPYGTIQVANGYSERTWSPRYRQLPARRRPPVHRQVEFRITKRDRRIAKRLAWYTGVAKYEIVQLKREGYRWGEIGRWLDVPQRVVRAAKHQRSWKHFLRDEQRYVRCGTGY